MSEQRGSLRGLADHLAQAVAPLDRMLRDPEAFAIAMGRVGWLAQELPPSYAAVADAAAEAVAAAGALADDAELAEVVVLLDAVGAVYRAVDDLTVAPPGADPDDFLPVIARELFEYLLADHLAKKAPGFLWALHGARRDRLRAGGARRRATGVRPYPVCLGAVARRALRPRRDSRGAASAGASPTSTSPEWRRR